MIWEGGRKCAGLEGSGHGDICLFRILGKERERRETRWNFSYLILLPFTSVYLSLFVLSFLSDNFLGGLLASIFIFVYLFYLFFMSLDFFVSPFVVTLLSLACSCLV
jgi:hypothetical protein